MCSIVGCAPAHQMAAPSNDESLFSKVFKKLIKGYEVISDSIDNKLLEKDLEIDREMELIEIIVPICAAFVLCITIFCRFKLSKLL